MNLDIIVTILLCAAVVIVTYALCAYLIYQRTARIKAIASKLHLEFDSIGSKPFSMEKIQLFSKGDNICLFRNVVRGIQENMQVQIFDYFYGPGGARGWTNYTVATIQMQTLCVPVFSIVPRSIFYPLYFRFNDKGIKFDECPRFAKLYLLQSSDERHIRLLFNSSVRLFYRLRRGVCTEGFGNTLVYYRVRGHLPPKYWATLLRDAQELANLLNDS